MTSETGGLVNDDRKANLAHVAGIAWSCTICFWLGMILPPVLVSCLSPPRCDAPIVIWLIFNSAWWFGAALSSIGPFHVLISGKADIQFRHAFALNMVLIFACHTGLFAWGAFGAYVAISACPSEIVIAYVCLDMIFAVFIPVSALIALRRQNGY